MYIWQLNKHVRNELESHNHVEMGYFKAPVSLKDPQMSAEEEIASHIQQRETLPKLRPSFQLLILSLSLEVKGL